MKEDETGETEKGGMREKIEKDCKRMRMKQGAVEQQMLADSSGDGDNRYSFKHGA